MMLDNQTLALIAIGASMAANCQPCLEHNVGMARQCGANHQQIAEAMDVGRRVRQGAASKMDKFSISINLGPEPSTSIPEGACECGRINEAQEVKDG